MYIGLVLLVGSCSKKSSDPAPSDGLASVQTGAVSDITYTSAKVTGTLSNEGGSMATGGVVYSKSPNPTLYDKAVASSGSGVGNFTVSLTNLEIGTLYHVRAYATNGKGTAYGEDKTFSTVSAPGPSLRFLADSMKVYSNYIIPVGYVDDAGLGTVLGTEFILSTNALFTDSTVLEAQPGLGRKSVVFMRLEKNTRYFIKMRSRNESIVSYSPVSSFTTKNGVAEIRIGSFAQSFDSTSTPIERPFYFAQYTWVNPIGEQVALSCVLNSKPTGVGPFTFSPVSTYAVKSPLTLFYYINGNFTGYRYFGRIDEPLEVVRVGSKLQINFSNLSEVNQDGTPKGTEKASGYFPLP